MVPNNDQIINLDQKGVVQNGKFPKKVWVTVEDYITRIQVDVQNLDINLMKIVKGGIDKFRNEIENLINLIKTGKYSHSHLDLVVAITNITAQNTKEVIVYEIAEKILYVVWAVYSTVGSQ